MTRSYVVKCVCFRKPFDSLQQTIFHTFILKNKPMPSAFSHLKVILWWEKYKDISSTLKDDSLSKLYSTTQSTSLYFRFSRSTRSLSVSSFFFSLRIIWARCSTYSATSFSGKMYLSENFLIASLSPLTSSLSSNNRLIWARGWKSSGSRPSVGVALQER